MAESTKDKETPQTYTIARLTTEAYAFFGVESHVAAGAFSLAKKSEFTREEAKALIDEFQMRKVN